MPRDRSLLSLCLLLSPLSLAGGCNRPGGGGEAAPIETRLEKAVEARQAMEDRGAGKAFPRELELAAKRIEEAGKLLAGRKLEAAKSKLGAAERTLRDLEAQLEALEKTRAAAREGRRAAEKALAEARQARAVEDAGDLFEEARQAAEAARADFDSGDPLRLEKARAGYQRVPALAQAARTLAGEKAQARQAMEVHRKAALAAEEEAQTARAEVLAAEDMVRARQSLRDADLAREQGRPDEAEAGFRAAESAFAAALARARAVAEDSSPSPALAPPSEGAGGEKTKDPPPQPRETPRVADSDERPAPDEAADGLSGEDALFLAENFRKLCSRVQPNYDPSTGEFTVEYPFGESMVKDLLFPHGPIPERHIGYRDRLGEKDAGGKKELGLTFTGNTRGFFLFPFPFRETVTVEYTLELGLLSTGGALSVILMSSPDGKNFLAADFGTVEVWSQGKLARAHLPRDPALRKNPGNWFKKDRVEMRIDYRPRPGRTGDPEKGAQASIGYDTADVLRGETPINVAAVPVRKGLVGFSWSGAKFNVRMLRISGKLDRPAAVKLLREKLSRGKSEPEIAGGPPLSPPEDAPGTAPGRTLAWLRGKISPQ